jgi:hypothetical protein
MHSPEALAFSIRSPFPSMRRKVKEGNPRWKSPIRHVRGLKFRYSPFMTLGGYEYYFDSWVDFWHMEPGGADSGTVCKTKWWKDKQGNQRGRQTWKWHFWHYKVSWSLIYKWRRHLLTRCAECGGPSRKGHVVNHSDAGWYGGPKVPIWCGEVHLYHSECLSKKSKRLHEHDPRGCYACSGKASFEFNRKQRNGSKELAKRLFGGK